MTMQLTRVDGLYSGVPYAYGTVVPPGAQLVLLAGSSPLDIDGRTVAEGDHVGQAEACMHSVRLALAAVGARLDDVVFVRVLAATAVHAELVAVWNTVHAAFGEHEPPGTLMGVTVLGWANQLVEVEVVAQIAAAAGGV